MGCEGVVLDDNEGMSLELLAIEAEPPSDGVEVVRLKTDEGVIACRFHPVVDGDAAVVWVGGAGGGLDGPAMGMYPRLARRLTEDSIASLRLAYRHPNELTDCVLDALMGVAYLQSREFERVALVGHSFGGAVVISAGVLAEAVVAVATLSSQSYGTDAAPELSPKPLLLIHGKADEVLPDSCSQYIYRIAGEPKELKLYPRCKHGLDACRDAVDNDLSDWLRRVLTARAHGAC